MKPRRRVLARRAQDRRAIRSGRIQLPGPPPKATCAGCLRDIRHNQPTFTRGPFVYCSPACQVKGRHHVDPRMCGGCHGTHPFGVRPGEVPE